MRFQLPTSTGEFIGFLNHQQIIYPLVHNRGWFIYSKNFPTYPWNIPQTQNQQFMKEFLSFGGERGGLGYAPGVCWGLLDIPNRALFVHCKDFHFTGGMTYHHPNLTARYADVLHPRSDRDPCSVPWGVCGGGPGEGDGEEHLGVNSRGKWVMIDDYYR